MSLFPELEKMAIRFAIILPNDAHEYCVYYTNSFEAAHSLLSQIESAIFNVDREVATEQPFMAVMTTNESLPDVNLLFVPIHDQEHTRPKILPIVGESSLYETSKPDVRQNMLILPIKHKVSLYKTSDAHVFVETIGTYIERLLRQA